MPFPDFTQVYVLCAGGADDPDASRAAAVVGAYFDAEQIAARCRLVWRAVAVSGLAGYALAATTSILTPVDLVFGGALLGTAAVTSALAAWRARKRLRTLLN